LNRLFGKTAVAAVVAGALSLFVVAPGVRADDRDRCQHAIEKAEARLDKAIRDKSEHSHEADNRRRDLNAERERCWKRESSVVEWERTSLGDRAQLGAEQRSALSETGVQ
jgi:hypothetical protein